jgi:cell division protein FtsI (penicillin-binding protein 3)
MSIGYEVQQTPLQTLAFYNAVANNGVFVKPQFVEQIRRNHVLVKNFEPMVLRPKICSDKTLKSMQECLVGVVKRGTGSALKSAYFDIAGKTGTAVLQNADGRYGEKGNKRYQASFVGYFPAKNPIYSCIVVVEAPSKDIYGAVVSGTVFSAIANKVFATSLQYHKAINEQKKVASKLPITKDGNLSDLLLVFNKMNIPYQLNEKSEWASIRSTEKELTIAPRKISKDVVPNVNGLTAKDAVYAIERLGMHVYIRGSGKVVSQTVPAGSPVVVGGLIELVLE